MISTKFQLQQVATVLILAASFFSCKKNTSNNSSEITDNLDKSLVELKLCDQITTSNTKVIFCKEWSNNDRKQKAAIFSKKRTGNSKEEFFVKLYDDENINSPYLEVYDFIEECPVDFSINLIEDSFTITDLNKNGKKEISFLYELSCQGGIGPIKMKSILIEDKKKYVIRGYRFDDVSIKTKKFPNYPSSNIDDNFLKNSSKEILDFAVKKWEDNYGTSLSNFNAQRSIKKVVLNDDYLQITLPNGNIKKFEYPYFLEDETPNFSIKNDKIVISCGDSYGNSLELLWNYSENEKSLFLETLIAIYPLKNKQTNNLKTCKVTNLNINIKSVDSDKIDTLLENSENCTFKTM